MSRTKNDTTLNSYEVEIQSVISDQKTTKSYKIRTLYSMGHKKSQIAKDLDIRYQHVRNVLLTPLKGIK